MRLPAQSSSDPVAAPGRLTSKLLGTALSLCLVYLLRQVLIPIVMAAGLAAVATPTIRVMERRFGMPRWVAALLAYLAYLAVFTGIGLVAVRTLAPELSALAVNLPQTLHQFLERLFGGETLHLFARTVSAREMTDELLDGLSKFAPTSGGTLQTAILGFSVVMRIVLTLVLLAYFMLDGPRIVTGMLWLVPPMHRPRMRNIAIRVAPIVGQYARGLAIITVYAIGLSWLVTRFVLNLRHAELLATMVGLLEMVPVIGPVVSTAAIGLLTIQQITWTGIIEFALFATILRVSIDQFVGPLVLGRALRLPPVVIILAFLVGGALLGVLGVLIAVPVAAAAKVVLQSLYQDEQ